MSGLACATGFALDGGETVSLADWWPMAAHLSEGVVQSNLAWMRARRRGSVSSLEQLLVRYEEIRDLAHGSLWPIRLAPAVIRDRAGNCLDLACYHAAYLRLLGIPDARVRIVVPAAGVEGHAVVVGPRNLVVDPLELCP